MTVAEFEGITDEAHRHELDKGELVVLPLSGVRAGRIRAAIINALGHAADGFGEVVGRCGFRLGTDTVIAPDVAFVRKERHPETIEGWPEFGPDLAVGILSADGGAAWVARKVAHYFAAGTSVVWVVDPESETVDVYERSGSFRTLTADDIIDAPGLLPGFAVPVRTLFE